MQPEHNQTLPPTYKQMLEEMGRQLSSRKSALMKRVLLLVWPYMLLVVAAYIFSDVIEFQSLPQSARVTIVVVAIVYGILALIYSIIVQFIFTIEKQIWADSFFDGKNLQTSESWRIARKIAVSAFVFRLKIFLLYYGVPTFIFFTAAALTPGIFGLDMNVVGVIVSWVIILPFFVIALIIYSYFVRTKLRYTWFVYLDKYGMDDNFSSIMGEVKKLNQISKSETFKKSLVVNLGTDSVNAIAQMAVGAISFGISNLGGVGKMIGGLTKVYGEELSRQMTDLGNISAQYMLYRFARNEAYGNEQHVNERLYSLK